jgi:hypothetical protein
MQDNEPLVKSQTVRLLDIFLFSPLMVYCANRMKPGHEVAKNALLVVATGTTVYNGVNYLRIRDWEQAQQRTQVGSGGYGALEAPELDTVDRARLVAIQHVVETDLAPDTSRRIYSSGASLPLTVALRDQLGVWPGGAMPERGYLVSADRIAQRRRGDQLRVDVVVTWGSPIAQGMVHRVVLEPEPAPLGWQVESSKVVERF